MKKVGRRRNDWTPPRKRRLVRLFTLTTIHVDDIVKVLQAYKFNPR